MRNLFLLTAILLCSINTFASLTRPKQYLPADNTTDHPTSALLYINNGTSKYQYEFQLSENSSFTDPQVIIEYQTSGTLVHVRFNKLKYSQTYYWRVKVRSATDSSDWSNTWSFTTGKSLTLYSPSSNGRTFSGSQSYFSWYRAHPYDSFVAQLDTSPNFNSNELKVYSTPDTFSTFYGEYLTGNLLYGTVYYFRLKGFGNGDSSDWTTPLWGNVLDTLSYAKVNNGDITPDLDVEFKWSSNREGYQFQMDTVPTFNSPMLIDTVNVNGSENYPQLKFKELLYKQKYYWRLRARNDRDTSSWVTYNFTTEGLFDRRISVSYPYTPDYSIGIPSISGSKGHIIQLDTTPYFDSHRLVQLDSAGQKFNFTELEFGQTYFVRGKAYHSLDTSDWCITNKFTVLSYVQEYYPRLNDTTVNIHDSLYWNNSIKGITHYHVQISKQDDWSNLFVDTIIPSDFNGNQRVLNGLTFDFNTKYYWRVRGWHNKDTSDWTFSTNKMYFRTVGAPSLVKPYNSDILKAYASTNFTWKHLKSVTCYQIVVAKDTNLTSEIIVDSFTSSANLRVNQLKFGDRYYWKVRSCSEQDTSDWSATWSFLVFDKVRLDYPKNNAVNYSFSSLDWNSIEGTTGYIIEYDTSSSFTNPTYISDTATNNFFHYFLTTPNYLYNTKYYWRVKVFHQSDTAEWSDVWSFTTKQKVAPELIYPSFDAKDIPLGISFSWEKYTGASTYILQYSENSNFVPFQQFIASTNSRSVTLKPATTYFWRVMSRNSNGQAFGDWSDVYYFKTKDEMDVPVLVSPANNTMDADVNLTVKWEAIDGVNYEVQLDDNAAFSSPVTASTPSTLRTYSNLSGRTQYYWRVRAKNAFTTGKWSDAWTFTTGRGLSVEEVVQTPFQVYPNPASTVLFVDSEILIQESFKLSITDAKQSVVYQESIAAGNSKKININIGDLSVGLYYLNIVYNDQIFTAKVSILR